MKDKWQKFSELEGYGFSEGLDDVLFELKSMLIDKRESYGPHNLAKFGDYGILVRTSDKIERLIHMQKEGVTTTAVNESALDAWRDIVGYGMLVLLAHSLEKDDA